MKHDLPAIALAASLILTPAGAADHEGGGEHAAHASELDEVTSLVAVIRPANDSSVSGTVTFDQVDGGVEVTAEITGLLPDAKHAIHIHEYGDVTAADGTSAGGHYSPHGHHHGLPSETNRHAGDLGNLETDLNGKATMSMVVENITLTGPENPIVGRAVIIHMGKDDGSQPTGGAGKRIGMGVIGIRAVEGSADG